MNKNQRRLFRRALALSGAGSQSKWISAQIRRLIREQQERFGSDLFEVLTEEEKSVVAVIGSGAAELQQIVEESLLPEKRVTELLADLVDRRILRVTKKGGKTDGARGAKIDMYFVVERKEQHGLSEL